MHDSTLPAQADPGRTAPAPAPFSILGPGSERLVEQDQAPDCFVDLNLDQIVARLGASKEEYALIPLLQTPLASLQAIRYRHHVMQDLEQAATCAAVQAWADSLRTMRAQLAQRAKLHERQQQNAWFLSAAETYCQALEQFAPALRVAQPRSEGFRSLQAYLDAYLAADAFAQLTAFCETHADYLDVTLAAFDREVQFYMAYLDHMKALRPYGLNFCYPDVEARHEHLYARETFDLALAGKLAPQGTTIVTNDFELRGKERIIIVSGPNQGGKTTFSRTFGQLHYLARLGLPVPGTAARLFLCDQIYTHYERQEDIRNQRGKLEDDLFRIHRILDAASPRSLIIMNEIFTSTTLKDALFLAHRILRQIVRLDLLCVCVTFIDELTQVSDTTVSMVSTVAPDEPARRTYKVIRRPADGLSYALSVAQKYQLDADNLERRLAR